MSHMGTVLPLRFDGSPTDVASVREGLPVELITEVARHYGLSQHDVLEAAGIPRSSVHRYKGLGRLNQEQSNRLYRVIYLLRRAALVERSPPQAANSKKSTEVYLQGSSPRANQASWRCWFTWTTGLT
jgi:uncharacterized protein (DUF2384 family)